jgi:hypothetical protein
MPIHKASERPLSTRVQRGIYPTPPPEPFSDDSSHYEDLSHVGWGLILFLAGLGGIAAGFAFVAIAILVKP